MMTMETIEIVMLLHCLVSRDNLLGDTFAVQSMSLSLPFMQCPLDDDDDDNNYDELMMAMDQHSPGHDHLNDGICPAR